MTIKEYAALNWYKGGTHKKKDIQTLAEQLIKDGLAYTEIIATLIAAGYNADNIVRIVFKVKELRGEQ